MVGNRATPQVRLRSWKLLGQKRSGFSLLCMSADGAQGEELIGHHNRPFNTRRCKADVLWPSNQPDGRPYYIPAGTDAPYSVWHLHRTEELWGPDGKNAGLSSCIGPV
jgi:hypothetical protein